MKAIIAKGKKTPLAVGFEFHNKKECRAFLKYVKAELKTIKPKCEDFVFMFDMEDIKLYKGSKSL